MTKHTNHFQPETVDEQLRQFSPAISRSTDRATPEARLIEDLCNIHADYTPSGARVWSRLAERLSEQNVVPSHLKLIIPERSHTERSNAMHIEEFTTQSMPALKPQRKPRRLFALIASLLVVAMLAGSFGALVVARHLGANTSTASSSPRANLAQTPVISPTPIYNGLCPNLLDQLYINDLCQKQQFQSIGQSIMLTNLPDQPYLKVEAGYVDHGTIIIWSHIEKGANVTTPPLADYLQPTSPLVKKGQIYTLAEENVGANGVEDDFDTYALDNLPVGTQTLSLKLTYNFFYVTSADHIVAAPTFNISLPVHPSQIIPVNQTVTANGISVTLNSVALDITGVRVSLASARLPYQTAQQADIQTSGALQVGGLKPFTGSYVLPEQALPLNQFGFTFKANLAGTHGTWTLTISSAAEPQPWVFHITV